MQIAKDGSGRVLTISGDLRINVAEELRAALVEIVCTASRPVINLSEVTECDTAALQLLISARRTAEHLAKPLELVAVPAVVQQAGAAIGLSLTAPSPKVVAGALQRVFDEGQANRGRENAV